MSCFLLGISKEKNSREERMQTFSDPIKEYTYKVLNDYFDNMVVEKVRDEGEFSIYMARIRFMLLNEQRYMVVMTAKDGFPPSHRKPLSDIRWLSLQTRTLTTEYDLLPQSYELKRNPVYEEPITIQSRDKKVSVYTMDNLPITISLLHTKGMEFEYPDMGTLNSALETYRTVIQFRN